ncbi:MAG: carbohydrate ABC transporter permease [Bacilli bacterium]|nr:carbohydrate ABC transporter permease [Bacilli bacterium]
MKKIMKRKGNKADAFMVVGFILLIVYSISFLTPLLWSLITSFKVEIDFMNNKISLPKPLNFQNYVIAFNNISVPIIENGVPYQIYSIEMIYNSLVYTILCTITHTAVPCITAYAVAKLDVKFGKVIYGIVIVTMILPIIGNLASEIQVSKALGLFDSMFGLAIMKGHFLGTNFLIFYAAFKSIAKDYSEAAYIDGASELNVLTKVQLPLTKTTISAIALLSFISFWNDYTTPMVYLPTRPTIAYGLYYFNQSTTNQSNFVTVRIAGCMIVTIPIFLIFLGAKNKLMGNLTVGGIKG